DRNVTGVQTCALPICIAICAKGAVAVDATGLYWDADGQEPVAQHAVFGGDYNTESTVEGGLMIATVRPGAVEARGEAVVEPVVRSEERRVGEGGRRGG